MNVSLLMTGALMALSLIIFVLLIFFINVKKHIPGKILLEALLASELIYIFGYTCELASNVISQKIAYNHFQYIGMVFIAPLWYLISIKFSKIKGRWANLKYLVFIVPVIALIGNFTHLSNQYFYKSYIPSNNNFELLVILYEKGILYYINNAFQSILTVLSALNFYNVFKKSNGTMRKQAAILTGLSVFGFFITVNSHLKSYTAHLDSGTIIIGVATFILLLTLFKYEFFELLPNAYVKVFESNDSPIIILNDSKTIVKCNTAAIHIFGTKLKKHRNINEIFSDEPELLDAIASNKSCIIKRTVDGMQMYFLLKLIKLDVKNDENSNEFGYLITFNNETEHINEVHLLENAAYVDPLTGVYNRRFFFEKANQILAAAQKDGSVFSLIMLDVDKFKSINDSFGHLSGDYVLKRVCSIIQEETERNSITARYGGEEFIILLPGVEYDAAMQIAERICSAIDAKQLKYGDEAIEVTVSLGVFSPKFPLSGTEVFDDFIAAADSCLYEAKKQGGNRILGANGVLTKNECV